MNILQRLNNHLDPNHLPLKAQLKEEIYRQREIILQYNLNGAFGLSVIGLLVGLIFAFGKLTPFDLLFYPAFAGLVGLITLRRTLPYNFRAIAFLATLASIGSAMLLRQALSGNGLIFMLTFVILTGIFFGRRAGNFCLLGVLVFEVTIGYLMSKSIVDMPRFTILVNSGQFGAWFISAVTFLYAGISLVMSINVYARGLSNTLQSQKLLSSQLESERRSLETRVQQRTEELSQRSAQMDAARRIANDISVESDLESLLRKAVNIIREEFNFYHAGIFIKDERSEYSVLRAATGEAGQTMLQRGHQLKIGEVGIVGFVTSKGEARITPDVTEDPNYYKNPLLPDTRSEMALPLRIGDRVIGALDVQSSRRNAFTPADVEVLQIIADQLATALDKANLLKTLQKSIKDLEESYRQTTRKSWQNFLRNSRKPYGFQYHHAEITPHLGLTSEAEQALQQVNLVSTQLEPGVTGIAVPINLRGQPIGVVNLRFATSRISTEMVALIRDATERLAVSLENARLLEELQFRAQRERLVGDISSKVRTATDVESILRIAANELGQSLGVAEVVVQLHAPD